MDCLCLFAGLLHASFLLLTGLRLLGFVARRFHAGVVSRCLDVKWHEPWNFMETFLYEVKFDLYLG